MAPFPGITTRWVTEITHLEKGRYFVDEQRFGPYSLWHHKHFIHEIPGGVQMEDCIDYKLPLGFLGHLLHGMVIKKQLEKIFAYRKAKLTTLFGTVQGKEDSLTFSTF